MGNSTKIVLIFALLFTCLPNNIFPQVPDTLWTKKYRESWDEMGRSVQQTLDGGYIIVADSYETGYSDAWLIKTDEIGNLIWDKTSKALVNNASPAKTAIASPNFLWQDNLPRR